MLGRYNEAIDLVLKRLKCIAYFLFLNKIRNRRLPVVIRFIRNKLSGIKYAFLKIAVTNSIVQICISQIQSDLSIRFFTGFKKISCAIASLLREVFLPII